MCPILRRDEISVLAVVLLGMANLYHASVDYMLGESLEYNRRKGEAGENRTALLHEVRRLQEAECGHLLRYIQLMRRTRLKSGIEQPLLYNL